jgi:hypothetical protein
MVGECYYWHPRHQHQQWQYTQWQWIRSKGTTSLGVCWALHRMTSLPACTLCPKALIMNPLLPKEIQGRTKIYHEQQKFPDKMWTQFFFSPMSYSAISQWLKFLWDWSWYGMGTPIPQSDMWHAYFTESCLGPDIPNVNAEREVFSNNT